MDATRANGYAPATINHRLAAIAGMFSFRQMRDPEARNPVPKGKEARCLTTAERAGLLAHVDRRPRYRSALRLREPRRLPRSLDPKEVTALVGSLRDRAIAGLMVFCGLRAGEVLSLQVKDVDIGGRCLLVHGKGSKERRVPLDVEVAGMIQTYLLVERTETASTALFVVAKGPHRGQPLTPAGLRRIFRYHREKAGVLAGHPHALRHTFGTALAEAGVSPSRSWRSWDTVSAEMSLRYGRLFDQTVRAEYERALDLAKARIGPLPEGRKRIPLASDDDWKAAPAIKARLAGGYCLRAPAQGACPYANICEHCPSFRTDAASVSVLAAQRVDAEALAKDAEARGWIDEAGRHRRLIARLDTLLAQGQAG
ncbi:MAG: tyrosine-type recombinase/integrase [Acidimicrobiales bacterium]